MKVDRDRKDHVEYTSTEINHPMDELILKVIFPSTEYTPTQCTFGVFYGKSKRVYHIAEEARISQNGGIESGREGSTYYHQLLVKHPVIGLNYALLWNPAIDETGAMVEGGSGAYSDEKALANSPVAPSEEEKPDDDTEKTE